MVILRSLLSIIHVFIVRTSGTAFKRRLGMRSSVTSEKPNLTNYLIHQSC